MRRAENNREEDRSKSTGGGDAYLSVRVSFSIATTED